MPRRNDAAAAPPPIGDHDVEKVRDKVAKVLRGVVDGCSNAQIVREVASASGLAARLSADPASAKPMVVDLNGLGRGLRNVGYHALATGVHRKAVEVADAWGLGAEAVLARASLAASLIGGGDSEARAVLRRAAKDDERMGCPDPAATSERLQAEAKYLLGQEGRDTEAKYLLGQEGRDTDAVALQRRAATICELGWGERGTRTLEAKVKLGVALREADMFDESRRLMEQLVPLFEQVHGPENEGTLDARVEQGKVLIDTGDLRGAVGVLRGAVEVAERTLGENHIVLYHGLRGLARALNTLGNSEGDNMALFAEAEGVLRRSVAIGARVDGRRSGWTLQDLNNLAWTLRRQGKLLEAEQMLQRVIRDAQDGGNGYVHNARANLVEIQRQRLDRAGGAGDGAGGGGLRAVQDMTTLLDGGVPERGCAVCGSQSRADGSGGDLYKCGACKLVVYCSAECQRRGWKVGSNGEPPHKESCTKARAEEKAGPEGKGRRAGTRSGHRARG